MNSYKTLFGMLLVMLAFGPVEPLLAQEQDSEEPRRRFRNRDRDGQGRGREGRPGRRGRMRQPRLYEPRDLAEKLPKLQDLMWDKMELSEDQRDVIGDLFDAQMVVVKEAQTEGKEQARTEARAKIRELQQDMEEARKDGDRERAREIRTELGQAMRDNAADGIGIRDFLRDVNDELEQDQRSQFRDLLRQSDLSGRMRGRRGQGQGMRSLRAALMSEDVGLTQDQRKAANELMRAYREARAGRDSTPEARQEQMDQLKQDVMDLLDEEQRPKFEAKVEEYEKNPPQRRRGNRGRGGGRRVGGPPEDF
ncbi:MAG: hypothetical protein ACYTHJ_07340 [Planctomycetota bacterium]|jgi:hypothetical protein